MSTELRVRELEAERDALFDELATSYESLSTIYEIGSDPSLLLCPKRALAHIIDRVLAFEDDLHAVFWLVDGDRLVPAQWRNTPRPEPRPSGAGLLGRVLAERRGVIVNHEGPESENAKRIAVSPMICRDKPLGVLAVWHEAEGQFDSRLMGLMTALASQAAMILEQDRLRTEVLEGARLRNEVEIGGHIQKALLFGETPRDLEGLDIGTVALASRHVDGDFFDFFRHGDHTVDVLLGDVMGKGIPAALVAAAVKSQFLRFAASGPDRLAQIVSDVHDQVAKRLVKLDRFVTAVFARFDTDTRTMTFVDCGHTTMLQYCSAKGEVTTHAIAPEGVANLPLGFVRSVHYGQAEVRFEPGDSFVLYSDGLTDARESGGGMFGVRRLSDSLAGCAHLPAQAMAEAICDAVRDFAADSIDDDLTCIVVKAGECGPGTSRSAPGS